MSSKDLRFDGRVAVVTGAGNGLGRSHAHLLASRGAKVVVNDLGGSAHGQGSSQNAADRVVAEIREAGGEAIANYDSVTDGEKIIQCALDNFGKVDIVINNAGILRDVSFHKMSQQDWDLIYQVHVLGSFKVTHAAWPHMREQQYGRVIMTSSAAGLYGNFGQANYSTAKLGLAGFGLTLAHEGRKRGIHVHTIAPVAGSRMTETILPPDLIAALKPEYVSPLVAYLCHESCEETGGIFEVGGGMVAKLRWQRTEGKMFRIGRDISPERIRDAWDTVVDFGRATYPNDAMSAIKPVLDNIAEGPSRGGNQYIDCDEALGYEFPTSSTSYDQRDLSLYALGVGAARDPLDAKDLQLVYEMHGDGFRSLPTYGVIPPLNAIVEMASKGKLAPGLNFGVERLLHGEQRLEVARPLPSSCTLTHSIKVRDIWDKGKHAVVVLECSSRDEHGDELIRNDVSLLIKGAGGWGGDRGPSDERNTPPERDPDATTTEQLSPNQALLYRLSGDVNPLHADPNFARAFGFERPILHGLCTFGHVARHVINAFCDGDPRLFKNIDVRFSGSVFPGETLVTEMWKASDTRIILQCTVKERDKLVISHAAVELYTEIPKAPDRSKQKVQAKPAEAASNTPISADVFSAIAQHIGQNAGLVQKIGKVFAFHLTGPQSAWTVDLKNAPGDAREGAGAADCTLEMTDADFMAMCAGKLNAQKLYFDGRLKISGDVMASQKLTFLAKLDPKRVTEAARARAGRGEAVQAEAEAAPAEAGPGEVFIGIGDHITRHPELVEKIGKVFLWKLTAPDSLWTLDLKNPPGGVTAGEATKPHCTLELTEADFLAMSRGELNPQSMYFDGKLKISGDVMASQKLTFLKDIDPEQAKAAVAAAKAQGGVPKAASSSQPTKPQGPSFNEVLTGLKHVLAQNPALAAEVGATIGVRDAAGDGAWTLDLRAEAASHLVEGTDGAQAGLTVTASDLAAWIRGDVRASELFQRGKLRVDGDLALIKRLDALTSSLNKQMPAS